MASIFDIPSAWRSRLQPASFKDARFHCEVNSIESGRRIVEHEFPKKDLPYAEDMGRIAKQFSLRGYCITFPSDEEDIRYRRNYQDARDLLTQRLNEEGAGTLQLPTYQSMIVVCARYRLTEEERFGGFCIFDMTFLEQGIDAQKLASTADTYSQIVSASEALRQRAVDVLSPPPGTPTDIRNA